MSADTMMTDSADSATSILWLHMLSHGGRWTATELAAVCKWTRARADALAADMAIKGFCSVYRSGKRKNGRAYGIGAGCKIPRGVRLDQVIEAAGVAATLPKDEPLESGTLPPRGQFASIGRVSSVFALGARA